MQKDITNKNTNNQQAKALYHLQQKHNPKRTTMKYKAMISDFDDTLLRSDFTISQASVEAIKVYREAGGFFTISTGRMWASIKKQLVHCGLDKFDLPIMNCQGSSAIMSLNGKVLFEEKIDSITAVQFLEYTQQNDLYAQVYVDDVLCVDEWTDMTGTYTDASKIDAKEVGNLAKYLEYNHKSPHKIVVMDMPSHTDKIVEKLQKDFANGGLEFSKSHPMIIEVTSIKAGKGNMAKRVMNHFGFDMKDVVCIGDSENDISMVKMAGFGACVGNARPALKAVSQLVVETNNDDGVAKMIYRILNNKI